MNRVGVSEIGVQLPESKLLVGDLAEVLKVDPVKGEHRAKAEQGLGLRWARVPCNTSIEEMAVAALRKVRHADVRRMYFATESDSDLSKPTLAVKVLSELGMTNVLPIQIKAACVAGVQGLIAACEYVSCTGEPALVVAADRSLYRDQDAAAAVTLGSAAVALRIESSGNIRVNFRKPGVCALDVDDFHVPCRSFPYPKVHGGLSKVAYRFCVWQAFTDWCTRNGYVGEYARKVFNEFSFIFHTPFPKMVKWAAAVIWNKKEPLGAEAYMQNNALLKDEDAHLRAIRQIPGFRDFYGDRVLPWLRYSPDVGNSYTAAVFLPLIALAERAPVGTRAVLVGYGSGAISVVLDLEIVRSLQTDLAAQIAGGREISVEEVQEWAKGIAAQYA